MMRSYFRLLAFSILCGISMVSCREKSDEKDHGHNPESPDAVVEESPNIALDKEVMKIHDEVMPKLDDIYRKKEELKNRIAATPAMPEAQKKELERRIAKLDSASESMFSWMNKYRPLPDSAGEEKARAYLESELENVKKVRTNILTALEEANKE